ncbi:MAG: hypothetical protein H0V09_09020 [Gemmatimonadetes bacterium]|nr:hypothetical protein [Gemmatimonadota bacterium]
MLSRIVVGNIDAVGDERVLEAPGTAIAGELVNVTVTTFGNSCVGAAGAAVVVHGMEAIVTPYDQEQLAGGCLDFRNANPRQVAIVFDDAGEAKLLVRGRSDHRPGIVSLEHRISVSARP